MREGIDVDEHQRGDAVIVVESPEPNLLIRALWFVVLGWWLSLLATLGAILLQLTIIGIPAAVWVINRIPQVTTLKSSRKLQVVEGTDVARVGFSDHRQVRWWIRALYYVLVGWWAVSLWLLAAWVVGITILLLPLAFWMYGATGTIQTLRR